MTDPHTLWQHITRRFHGRSLVSAIADGVERASWRLRGPLAELRERLGELVDDLELSEWVWKQKRSALARGVCWVCNGDGDYWPGHSNIKEPCDECNGTGLPTQRAPSDQWAAAVDEARKRWRK